MNYREAALSYIDRNGIKTVGKDMYLFGIFSGNSLIQLHDFTIGYSVYARNIHAFDSFEGLPVESPDVENFEFHKPGRWHVNEFFGKMPVKEIICKIEDDFPMNCCDTKFYVGWFKDTLNAKNLKGFKPASFVDIDCDLYISTIDILEFMFDNKLIVKDTVIGFDDWGATEEFKGGESLAWLEMTEKYNVDYEEIFSYGERPHIQKAFVVTNIGG